MTDNTDFKFPCFNYLQSDDFQLYPRMMGHNTQLELKSDWKCSNRKRDKSNSYKSNPNSHNNMSFKWSKHKSPNFRPDKHHTDTVDSPSNIIPFKRPDHHKFSRITQRIDSSQVKRISSSHRITVTYADSVDWSKFKPIRGGVIVYTVFDNTIYFGLGVDTQSGNITDFGGGIRYKRDRTALFGGLREFMEESLCSFGLFNELSVKKNAIILSDNMFILFLHLDVDIHDVTSTFNKRVSTCRNPEINGLFWIPLDSFLLCIRHGFINTPSGDIKMYSRVRKLLQQAGDFTHYL